MKIGTKSHIIGNRLLVGGKTEAPVTKQESGQLNAAADDKAYGKTTSGDIHADYARTVAEIQKLREEESQLRMENIELKVKNFSYFFSSKK